MAVSEGSAQVSWAHNAQHRRIIRVLAVLTIKQLTERRFTLGRVTKTVS